METTNARETVKSSVMRAENLLQYYRNLASCSSESSDWSNVRDIVVDLLHFAGTLDRANPQSIVEAATQLFEEEDAAALEEEESYGF